MVRFRGCRYSAEDGSNKAMIYEAGGSTGAATRTPLGISFSQRHRQVLINAVSHAPSRIKTMDLDGGNVQTLFEANPLTTVIGGFVVWADPVGLIQFCEKTDHV